MSTTTPPTIILIHDSFHQAAHYIDFDAALQEVGLREVRIPQLPSCSQNPPENAFEADVAIVRKTILSCLHSGREVMLVAHGYGGKLLSDASEGVPVSTSKDHVKVLGIIFVAAGVYEEGEKGEESGSFVKSQGTVSTVTDPSKVFFNTLADRSAVEKATSLIVPSATAASTSPVKTASWSHYPCAYVQCLQDKAFPVESQERAIAKLKKRCEWDPAVAKLDSDHDPFLSQPQKLAQLVKKLVDDALE